MAARKTTLDEYFFCLILLVNIAVFNANAQLENESPYAIFGDNTPILDSDYSNSNLNWRLIILMPDSTFAQLEIKDKTLTVTDYKGNIITSQIFNPTVYSSFSSVDPHAMNYLYLSPYSYCGGDPVNAVDPDGKDWYQNNQTLYYTWFDGDDDMDGYTYIGGKGSVLGEEFENILNTVLCGEDGLGLESLYSNGFTFDIAPNDKGGLFGSDERGWDFFDEFVYGTGPEFSVLLADHPYTQAIMHDKYAIQFQNVVKSRGRHGKYINVGRANFYPWDAGLFSPMQFIGTYRYDGYGSKDGRSILNIVTDSKSVYSLFYHSKLFGKNYRRSQKESLGNTYQFYIWRSLR